MNIELVPVVDHASSLKIELIRQSLKLLYQPVDLDNLE